MNASLPRPGPVNGPYPHRTSTPRPLWADFADRLGDSLTGRGWARAGDTQRFMDELAAAAAEASARPDERNERAMRAARSLSREGFSARAVARAQAVAAEAVEAALGQRPYPSQHLAAFHMLSDRLVELDTGEGKSLAVLLAALTAAIARVPTHVVTANEYLAVRDAEAASRALALLGMSAGAIRAGMDSDERRAVYACDVVYARAQEIGFDYLRDRLAGVRPDGAAARPVLRGLCLALVDEADSVLLDHAATPLVLGETGGDAMPAEAVDAAWRFARTLRVDSDFALDAQHRRVQIVPAVMDRLPPDLLAALPMPKDTRMAAELLADALVARHALWRDGHYIVRDGDVLLVDRNTGRTLPGTVWSRGLQHMVHIKEGLAPPVATRASMQITLQTFFGRYLKLAGISGTLSESRLALWIFYRLGTRRVAPRRASLREDFGLRVYARLTQQLDAVAARVQACVDAGRAVLVGTDTVAAADIVSAHLRALGIVHRLLTARDDTHEAELIARAGEPGAVTVATHIAGRGTDIVVAQATLDAGGLHVIGCAPNGSGRVDRQLFGRTARNGARGSCEAILSLEDPAFVALLPEWLMAAVRRLSRAGEGEAPRALGHATAGMARMLRGWDDLLRCYQLAQHDKLVRASLAFASQPE